LRAFIDTSSLIKKYIAEEGSDQIERQLEIVTEIIISSLYLLEINAAIERRIFEKTLTNKQAVWIRAEVKKDLHFFGRVLWNDNLEQKALEMIRKHHLKTLDGLQLASGCLSKPDLFITSDKRLFKIAKKELKIVILI
tara:strand:- start:325 stop:738 length:414 start_codon:yes stop_codon:yes gene_type:complete